MFAEVVTPTLITFPEAPDVNVIKEISLLVFSASAVKLLIFSVSDTHPAPLFL